MRLFKRILLAVAMLAAPMAAHAADVSNDTVSSGGQNKSLSSWFEGLPGLQPNLYGTGQPGILAPNGWFVYDDAARDKVTLRAQRSVAEDYRAPNGGTHKAIWGLVSTNRYSGSYEWGITGEMYNKADESTGAQNVAVAGTIFKVDTGGQYQVGPSWGMNPNCTDLSTQQNPTSSCIGAEVDSYTNATGTDIHRQRVGIQVALGQHTNNYTTPTHFGYGILMGANQSNIVIDRAISLRSDGTYGLGLDTAKAKFTGPAIYMGANQRIAFDGDDNGGFNRSLRWETGILAYQTQNGNVFQVTDEGTISANAVQSEAYKTSGGITGVSCNGPPTANFRVVNGIVVGC